MEVKNIVLEGELTIYTVNENKDVFVKALEDKATSICIDLSQVTEIDSAGLQLFLWLKREATNSGRELVCKGMSDAVQKTLLFVRQFHHFKILA